MQIDIKRTVLRHPKENCVKCKQIITTEKYWIKPAKICAASRNFL